MRGSHEPSFGEGGVSEEEREAKRQKLERIQAKRGRAWNELKEKLLLWRESSEESALDLERQSEFPDWPNNEVNQMIDDVLAKEQAEEEWGS